MQAPFSTSHSSTRRVATLERRQVPGVPAAARAVCFNQSVGSFVDFLGCRESDERETQGFQHSP
jgi:hypothetical protein